MKKILTGVLLWMFLVFPAVVHADGSSFSIGLSYFYFDYKEDLALPSKSTESGWLPGVYLSLDHKVKSATYTRLYASYSSGDITYDGATQTGTPIKYSDSNQKFIRLEWDLGYNFPARDDFSVIPYTGVGFSYWQRGQPRVTSTYTSYEEDYYWGYLPLGLKFDYRINNKWSIGSTLAVHFMFGGKMKARWSQVTTIDDAEYDLGNKPAYYADIPITYKFAEHWAVELTPWYMYSQIGQSNTVTLTSGSSVVGTSYEPASDTHQYGVNLGINYIF